MHNLIIQNELSINLRYLLNLEALRNLIQDSKTNGSSPLIFKHDFNLQLRAIEFSKRASDKQMISNIQGKFILPRVPLKAIEIMLIAEMI